MGAPLAAVQAAGPRVPHADAQAPLRVVLGPNGAKVMQRACDTDPSAACIGQPLAFGVLGSESFVRPLTVLVVRDVDSDCWCLYAWDG